MNKYLIFILFLYHSPFKIYFSCLYVSIDSGQLMRGLLSISSHEESTQKNSFEGCY